MKCYVFLAAIVLTSNFSSWVLSQSPKQEAEGKEELDRIVGTWVAEREFHNGKATKPSKRMKIQKDGTFTIIANNKTTGLPEWTAIDPKYQVMLQSLNHIATEHKLYKYFIRENELVVVQLASVRRPKKALKDIRLAKKDLDRIADIEFKASLQEFSKNRSGDVLPYLEFRMGTGDKELSRKRYVTVTVFNRKD